MYNKNINFYFKIFLPGLIILFLYVCQCVQVSRLKYKINRLENEISFFKNENKYLHVRLTELTSLKRVEKIAREKLGLVYPKKDDVIIIFE